jgi:hypothetical protein
MSLLFSAVFQIAVSIINCDRYFVFMTATVENPILRKSVNIKGSKPYIALSDTHGYSLATSRQI